MSGFSFFEPYFYSNPSVTYFKNDNRKIKGFINPYKNISLMNASQNKVCKWCRKQFSFKLQKRDLKNQIICNKCFKKQEKKVKQTIKRSLKEQLNTDVTGIIICYLS